MHFPTRTVVGALLEFQGAWTAAEPLMQREPHLPQEVPARLHAPLDQGVVITKRGAANPAATRYLAFLRALKTNPPANLNEIWNHESATELASV